LVAKGTGAVSPADPKNVGDPNNGTVYQLAEVQQTGKTANAPLNVFLDGSTVDQFGLGVTYQLTPIDIKKPDGTGVILGRTALVKSFVDGATGTYAPFLLCVNRAGTATDPYDSRKTAPVRILAPQDVLALPAPSDPTQLAQYNALNTYFDSPIGTFFTTYQSSALTLYYTVNNNGQVFYVPYQGKVVQVAQMDVNNKSQNYWVIEFTGGNNEKYNVYYPYFSTNTPSGDTSTLYGAAGPPPPPIWWKNNYPKPSLDPTASASKMVFGSQGVFADNAFQPASAYTGSPDVLANLEKQVAVALNRGVGTSMVVEIGSIAGSLSGDHGIYTTTATVTDNTKLSVGMNVWGPGTNGPLTISAISTTDKTSITLKSYTPIYPVNPQPLTFSTYYPTGGTWNYYAAFWHDPKVSIDSLAYGFSYDDQGGTDTGIAVLNAKQVKITVN